MHCLLDSCPVISLSFVQLVIIASPVHDIDLALKILYSTYYTLHSIPLFAVISCDAPPPALQYGKRSFQTTTFGSIANYSCNHGYTISGRNQLTCMDTGEWSGSAPKCQGISFFAIVVIVNHSKTIHCVNLCHTLL